MSRRAAIGVAILLLAATVYVIAARNASRAEPTENRDASAVTAFGAKGDGVADDTDAVRRAVEESRGGVIEFPRGTYRLTRTIEIRLDQRGVTALSGRGVGRVVMAGPGPAFRFIGTHTGSADPASFKPAVWERERMPTIDGLEIVGAHEEADGVEFVRVMQPTLSRVCIREVRHAVRLTERDRNLLIDGCHIYNCRGVGVFLDRVNLHQAIVSASHISYCKGGGIKVVGSEIRNLQIVGNDIEYNYDPTAKESADVWIDSTTGSVREGTIVGNTIQAKISPGGANVRLLGPANVNLVSMWTITGNHISNQEVNIHLVNCRGIVLTGNSLALSSKRNLLIEGSRHIVVGPHALDHNPDYKKMGDVVDGITLRDCDGCSLTGVLVEGAVGGSETEGGAIEVLGCRETTLSNCQVFEPKWRGIVIHKSRNTRVTGCTVVDRTDNPTLRTAIESLESSSIIVGNTVQKGADGIVRKPALGIATDNVAPAR